MDADNVDPNERLRRDYKNLKDVVFENVAGEFYNHFGQIFGIESLPSLDVNLGHMYIEGFFCDPNKIHIGVSDNTAVKEAQCCTACWNAWTDGKIYTFTHELAHFYHYTVNSEGFNRKKCDPFRDKEDWGTMVLTELVADLSALRYFDIKGRLPEGFKTATLTSGDWSLDDFDFSKKKKPSEGRKSSRHSFDIPYDQRLFAREFYERNKGQIDVTIEYLAKSTYGEVASVIDEYIPSSIFCRGLSAFERFSMCCTLTDIEPDDISNESDLDESNWNFSVDFSDSQFI